MLEICPLASGSSGNAICVGNDHAHVLIDAGVSGKRIEEGLNTMGLTGKDIDAIMITHEHIDHIAGLGVLARKLHVPMYATSGTIQAIKDSNKLGKIDEDLFHPITAGEGFTVKDLEIKTIPTSHDAADPCAYRITYGQKKVAVMTDLGNYNQLIVDELQGLDALLLEANHDVRMLQTGPYPYYLKKRILSDCGHLSNERSGQLLCQLLHDNFKAVILGHLSKENNMEELAYEAVRMEITMGDNPYKAGDFPIYVAKRDVVSQGIQVN